jgi:hypothetical protein
MILNIEKELQGQFEEKVTETLREHNISDFSYLGSSDVLTILKVDKE